MTKTEACKEYKVSLSTLDRWISSGRVQIKKEPHGRRHRVYVVLEDGGVDRERIPASRVLGGREGVQGAPLPDNVSLAVAHERVRGLEELVAVLKDQLQVERERYTCLVNDLRAGRLLVSGAERQRRWWRFWRGIGISADLQS